MQALTVRGGWTYDISFEMTNLNDASRTLFRISQDRNVGEYRHYHSDVNNHFNGSQTTNELDSSQLMTFYFCLYHTIGSLQLMKPVVGPAQFSVHVEMNVQSYGYYTSQKQSTRYVAIINIFFSAYNFWILFNNESIELRH